MKLLALLAFALASVPAQSTRETNAEEAVTDYGGDVVRTTTTLPLTVFYSTNPASPVTDLHKPTPLNPILQFMGNFSDITLIPGSEITRVCGKKSNSNLSQLFIDTTL
jgi:hypothetical protein